MLKHRRGLFAAAITAAVVGSIGFVSTLDAGAEQIPAPAGAPAVDPADPAPPTVDSAPPALLPWGAEPEDLQTGRDGASSKSLKKAGLDAAAPDASGEQAGEEYAPKGGGTGQTFRQSEQTTVVPPKPPALNAAAAAVPTDGAIVHFHYNVGSQLAVTDGVYANMTIGKPQLDKADYHTLAEVAVQTADGLQAVEVGWTVDRVVNKDDDPHLFVYHWVDGKPTCYNGCGFVQHSANIRPGDTLPQDTAKKFGIQYVNGAWWIAYESEWVGYYPNRLWNGTFTKSGNIQIFGEVASATPTTCTDMGNGLSPTDTAAAKLSSVTYLNGPAVDLFIRSKTDSYDVAQVTSRSFRYGGPGDC